MPTFLRNAIKERFIPSVMNNDITSYVTDLSQMQGKETEILSTEHTQASMIQFVYRLNVLLTLNN